MFENTETSQKLYVKLRANPFGKDSFIGTVPRNTVNMDAVVTAIAKRDPGISKFTILHSAELLKEEIAEQLSGGRAVNVLGLGTMYIGIGGKISTSNPSSIQEFVVKFTPSKAIQNAVSQSVADGIIYSDANPQIDTITGCTDGNTEGKLLKNDFVEISGDRLKVGGSGSGIFFVPAETDGTPAADETKWIAADLSTLRKNMPRTLLFKLPEALAAETKYFIAVRSSVDKSGIEHKTTFTGFSSGTVTAA